MDTSVFVKDLSEPLLVDTDDELNCSHTRLCLIFSLDMNC